MDWNRDGKVDAHDATLYNTVINTDIGFESGCSSYGSGRSYSNSNKSHSNETPANITDSRSAGWVIAVVAITLLYFFFS